MLGFDTLPGAKSNLTKRVTWNVPLALGVVAPGANVFQVPPPVTSSGSFGWKTPVPLSVIFELSFAKRVAAAPPLSDGE